LAFLEKRQAAWLAPALGKKKAKKR
jgi:hypothetical protein